MNSQHACVCSIEAIPVVAIVKREGLRWHRAALYVDGKPTRDDELHVALAEAKARRQVEAEAARWRATLGAVREEARKAAESARRVLRH